MSSFENYFIDIGSLYGTFELFNEFPGNNLVVCIDANLEAKNHVEENQHFIHALLGEQSGILTDYSFRKNTGLNSIYEIKLDNFFSTIYDPKLLEKEYTKQLYSTTLDDELSKLKIKPSFIKIDAEGSEEQIVNGSLKSLDRCWGLIIEISFNSIYKNKNFSLSLISKLNELGFDFINFYKGIKGVPQHILVNPINYSDNNKNYGVIVSADVIFLKKFRDINWDNGYTHKISYLNFCLGNNLVDLAFKNIEIMVDESNFRPYFRKMLLDSNFSQITWSTLLQIYEHLGSFRFAKNDPRFDLSDNLMMKIFGINLLSGAEYWNFYYRILNKEIYGTKKE